MSLEWAERIKSLREALDFSQDDLAVLLGITQSAVSAWEVTKTEETTSWERIIQFLIDCPSESIKILSQQPWLQGDQDWEIRIRELLKKLHWTEEQLGDFLGHSNVGIMLWNPHGSGLSSSYKILISLLEIYSELEPDQWPAALYLEPYDIVSPERVKLIRIGLSMRLVDLGNLFHMEFSSIGYWERGTKVPGWCANLLLKVIETYPRAVDLIARIPWGDEKISPERAKKIRGLIGLTQLEMERLLGTSIGLVRVNEATGVKTGCAILVYQLLEQYPEEFLSYVQGLSSPGGQACPIW